jgi:hypothetical protein
VSEGLVKATGEVCTVSDVKARLYF